MKLAYWMYAGPAHIGTLRVASSFKNVHAIMHAPLGDDYFNVMRSMLERERDFTPVTASIVDRHVLARGSQNKVVETITRKDKEEKPDLILLTPTCTSSILQEDLQNFVDKASLEAKSDVILADVNHYRVNELQAADRTLEQVVRFYIEKAKKQGDLDLSKTQKPSANILGIFTLGFHNQHDCRELKKLLNDLGVSINLIIPEGGSVTDLQKLPQAWFNIVPYREAGLMTGNYLLKEFDMPLISTTPMGVVDTAVFVRQIGKIVSKGIREEDSGALAKTKKLGISESTLNGVQVGREQSSNSVQQPLDGEKISNSEDPFEEYIDQQTRFVSQAAWFSRSIDCQNLTGKKSVVFGDSTHAASMTRILAREMGVRVCCAGTYCKHDADWFREQVQDRKSVV